MNKASTSNAPLTNTEIAILEDSLFAEQFEEDSLDYFGIHGMLCAFAVGPIESSPQEWLNLAFGQAVSEQSLSNYTQIGDYLMRTFRHVRAALNAEEPLELPAETYEDSEALANWCVGFMEGFMAHESQWFEHKQDLVAELLLPIMAVSDLFDDPEFQELTANPKIMDQLAEQIPEVLTDLYLLFHSGE